MRKLLAPIGSIFLAAFVFLIAIWFFPSIVVRPALVGPMLRKFVPGIRWSEFAISATSVSFWKKRIELEAKEIVVSGDAAPAQVDAKKLAAAVTVQLKPGHFAIHVERLDGDVEKLGLPFEASPPKKEEAAPSLPQLCGISFENVVLDVRAFTYGMSATENVTGQVSLRTIPDQTPTLDLRGSARAPAWRGELHLGAHFVPGDCWVLRDADLDVTGSAGDFEKISLKMHTAADGELQKWDGFLRAEGTGKKAGTFGINGKFFFSRAGALDFTFDGSGKKLAGPVPRVTVENCAIRWRGKEKKDDASLSCSVRAFTDNNTLSPPGLRFLADGQAWAIESVVQRTNNDAHGTFKFGPKDQRPVQLTLEAKATADLRKFPQSMETEVKLALDIPDFKNASLKLSDPRYVLPAPFAVLRGKARLDVDAKAKWDQIVGSESADAAQAKLALDIDLKSETERLSIGGEGDLSYSATKGLAIASDITLRDVALTLPYLSLKPPRFVPDGRMRSLKAKRGPKEKKPLEVHYDIHVHTPSDKPFRLRSNLAKNPIPVTVDLRLSDSAPMQGSLALDSFQAELFRRQAIVERFRLNFPKSGGGPEIDAKIRVPYAEYVVHIAIMGRAEKPTVTVQTEPPLPEQDAYAVLLFGRPISGLGSEEAESSSNVRAAVLDGAVGLASMYVLASTPIESVGYNAATATFSARVRLQEGTALVVGTDLERLGQVGLRKRLAPNLYLHTYMEDPLESARRSVGTFLEWSIGY